MKAFLMYKDHDFDLQLKLPWNEQTLIQDLELNTLINAMALSDEFLFDVSKKAILSSLKDLDTILYRQDILKDCLKNPSIIRDIFDIALKSIKSERDHYWGLFKDYPSTILNHSLEVLPMFVGMLKKLKDIADDNEDKFESEGFIAFFSMIRKELNDEYFASVEEHLQELKSHNEVLISANLGSGNKGANYILRKPPEDRRNWIKKVFDTKPPCYTFYIADRDDNGARALSELKDMGINHIASALAQSADHILSFFNTLRNELAFYIGNLNLHTQLSKNGEPISFPTPLPLGELKSSFNGLYDICLALTLGKRIVGSNVNADKKELIIITGANQGGKSTFLRSIGLSQLMMQCGMFVPAESYCSNVCNGLFTHYKREEDNTMNSGKLDEELSRMSYIVDNITPNCMLLFNESFASTNEREGSGIANQITCALLEKHIKVFCVTHLYELAHGFYNKNMENAIFLRAERQTDGERTFKIIEGEPLETSYGQDLYDKVFVNDN